MLCVDCVNVLTTWVLITGLLSCHTYTVRNCNELNVRSNLFWLACIAKMLRANVDKMDNLVPLTLSENVTRSLNFCMPRFKTK